MTKLMHYVPDFEFYRLIAPEQYFRYTLSEMIPPIE